MKVAITHLAMEIYIQISHHVEAMRKVAEQYISKQACERALCQLTVCFEFQSRNERRFRVTSDLLSRENLKVDIAQLCNELKGCNFTVV